ncbi:Hypothetical protein SRAE_1000346800 [Strongyloides ratti]|uniref:Uncharacterized protein n=1 Tax=Strongyloides ratti TaxID=34506 RepID=A0A090LCL1_STRRB|nr:Hypothetical protein SRAE_1000346800 [Strongyloides ratti]CEF65215.1 Hypothetical protein SRAE_1000346800 [Strongyloides ratti]
MKLLLETLFFIIFFSFIVFLVSTSPTKNVNKKEDNFLNVPIESINKLKKDNRPKMIRQNAFDNDTNRFYISNINLS